jgi:hypothetical protein
VLASRHFQCRPAQLANDALLPSQPFVDCSAETLRLLSSPTMCVLLLLLLQAHVDDLYRKPEIWDRMSIMMTAGEGQGQLRRKSAAPPGALL